MGRHRKKPEYNNVRRTSLLALSGLVPAGVVSATSGATAVTDATVTHLPEHNDPINTGQLLALGKSHRPAAAAGGHTVRPIAAKPEIHVQPGEVDGPLLPVSMKTSPLGIPPIAVEAYKSAERRLDAEQPGCGMNWELLAGIGRVESHHANDGDVDSTGTAQHSIYGPSLDGSLAGNEVISDGAGGYQRAMGPMQFMPGTWQRYAKPGSNPQNLFDAAYTAGRYLCAGGLDMRELPQRTRAILRYNNSMAYVANVMAWSLGYATGIVPAKSALPWI
ncbi:MAG: murein transglycosylase [Mycobacteriaceae bacterium]|nr:murein transglycosylase [Mycobacteriaceae bacterium]